MTNSCWYFHENHGGAILVAVFSIQNPQNSQSCGIKTFLWEIKNKRIQTENFLLHIWFFDIVDYAIAISQRQPLVNQYL